MKTRKKGREPPKQHRNLDSEFAALLEHRSSCDPQKEEREVGSFVLLLIIGGHRRFSFSSPHAAIILISFYHRLAVQTCHMTLDTLG